MSKVNVLIGAALLVATCGFADKLINAEDYTLGNDVVLESAVDEVKSIPKDTTAAIDSGVTYVLDETVGAVKGAKALLSNEDPHAEVRRQSEMAIDTAWDTSNDILLRSYKVSNEMGELLMTAASGSDAPSIDVRNFFDAVEFSDGETAYYMPKLKRLIVRQTMPNILSIENVLADYHGAQRELKGHQVEIEAKFVETSQNTLDELGFNWHFDSKGGGDAKIVDDLYLPAGTDLLASGLRSTATALASSTASGLLSVVKNTGSLRWQMLINALEQAGDSDVLSAPRVVTLDGNEAVIQVGDEQMIPKSFDVNNSDTSPYVEHSDWDLELMGVYMEVTPELRDEGLIDLELNTKITDLIGFDGYVVVPPYKGNGLKSDPVSVTASLPYVRIRELDTRVTVADGNTVAMGGLTYDRSEKYHDKVPVLGSIPYIGRLFRSEGEKSVKRNLIIFVTATQVDLDGTKASDLASSH